MYCDNLCALNESDDAGAIRKRSVTVESAGQANRYMNPMLIAMATPAFSFLAIWRLQIRGYRRIAWIIFTAAEYAAET